MDEDFIVYEIMVTYSAAMGPNKLATPVTFRGQVRGKKERDRAIQWVKDAGFPDVSYQVFAAGDALALMSRLGALLDKFPPKQKNSK